MEFEELETELCEAIIQAEEIAIENIKNAVNFSPFIFMEIRSLKNSKPFP